MTCPHSVIAQHYDTAESKMIFHLFLLLWASHSVSLPASLSGKSYLTDVADQHDITDQPNVTSQSASLSEIIPRMPDYATHDQQIGADDDVTTLADLYSFKMTCNKNHRKPVLMMEMMWSTVSTVLADLEKGIYPMSTDWAEAVPHNQDMTVWMHVDIIDPDPKLVNTKLVENMFRQIVYDKTCYGLQYTKGGSVMATRAGQKNKRLVNVSIYAVNRKDAEWMIGDRL